MPKVPASTWMSSLPVSLLVLRLQVPIFSFTPAPARHYTKQTTSPRGSIVLHDISDFTMALRICLVRLLALTLSMQSAVASPISPVGPCAEVSFLCTFSLPNGLLRFQHLLQTREEHLGDRNPVENIREIERPGGQTWMNNCRH